MDYDIFTQRCKDAEMINAPDHNTLHPNPFRDSAAPHVTYHAEALRRRDN